MEGAALFLFLATGAISLFSFLTLTHWVSTRKAERIATERLALYRRLGELPTESAAMVLERLREEEFRHDRELQLRAVHGRRDTRRTGVIIMAAALGLGVFLLNIVPNEPVWTVSLIPVLIGFVFFVFGAFSRTT